MIPIKNTFLITALVSLMYMAGCDSSQKNAAETSAAVDSTTQVMNEQWTVEQANAWYDKQPWLVGANFSPSNAINQLEMWQADTWSPDLIDKELGWAADLGMNTMRVYLHDIPYWEDSEGFKQRIDEFLTICQQHNIRPMLVIFDSVWDPYPEAGTQPEPTKGLHNSGWVQSPGADFLSDRSKWPQLRAYVMDLVGSFKDDDRILAWDITNEPDNDNANSYGSNNLKEELSNKKELGVALVKEAFGWAREANPSQPITSAPWYGDWSSLDVMNDMNRWLFTHSDIITFHNYDTPEDFQQRVEYLKQFNRPMICTEYMARPAGSTFQTILPIAKENNVGMINWGFVAGKSNTIYPWDSWQQAYDDEPPVWFHDIFREDGRPYRPEEVAFIKEMTGK
ncbi:MAG: endo-1,4-beta-xylanase [Cyclobacteriaceae bacterium]